MKLVTDQIKLTELKQMSSNMFGGLVKAFVDIEKNIRPNQNNRSRSVEDPKIQKQIIQIVKNLVKHE